MTMIAALGLGAMGLPMATRLAHTYPVRGFDPAPERVALAAEAAVVGCGSAREAATGATIAVVAVRNQAQFEALLWGADGIAAVREVAESLAPRGIHLVDAPISGGPVRAGNGDLLITVGASDEAWELALPVLELLASTLKRMGTRPGDGQAMKTVNQLLCGVHIAAAGEALALADTLGLDGTACLEALMAGAAASFMLGDRGPRALQAYDGEGAEVKSRLDIFVKDMGIVTSAARGAGLATPVAAAAEQLFLLGQAQGLGTADDSSVIRVVAPRHRR